MVSNDLIVSKDMIIIFVTLLLTCYQQSVVIKDTLNTTIYFITVNTVRLSHLSYDIIDYEWNDWLWSTTSAVFIWLRHIELVYTTLWDDANNDWFVVFHLNSPNVKTFKITYLWDDECGCIFQVSWFLRLLHFALLSHPFKSSSPHLPTNKHFFFPFEMR